MPVEIVAAVDVPVTVDARRADHHIGPGPPPGPEIDAVKGNMALPAQPDCRGFQQVGIGAAVGQMTIEAILHDGRVLKKERTPILGVTFKAKFSIGKLPDELGRSGPMRVVATGAVHLLFALGMMRKPQLGADLVFMTGKARIPYR